MNHIAEQVTGQLLRTLAPSYVEPKLYYWLRHEKGSSAEIDFMLQQRMEIIPVEVKAGSAGTLKSLHLFMNLKNLPKALRIYSSVPSQTDIEMKDPLGKQAKYTLFSIPFYLIGQLHRLL